MWFKQVQLFQLESTVPTLDTLIKKLEDLAFSPCLPSMQFSIGWVAPVDSEDSPLACSLNSHIMICMQIEEKILPNTVIQQELSDAVSQMELAQNRKLKQKEKYTLKDEITLTLLPRAFSKYTKVYAYIDTQNQWLVLGTTNPKKTEQFISLFKKAVTEDIRTIDIKNISNILTDWLKQQNYPSTFSIAKSCVLQDPNQENRVIRCKHQDLFVSGIQSLIKDGCMAVQLALTWEDRVDFVLAKDFGLSNIQFHDEVIAQSKEMEPETKLLQFSADFLIMTGCFTSLFTDLLEQFAMFVKSDNVVSIDKHEVLEQVS